MLSQKTWVLVSNRGWKLKLKLKLKLGFKVNEIVYRLA